MEQVIWQLGFFQQEKVRRLFQQQSANVGNEFGRWCDQALRSLHASNVDSKSVSG